MHFLPAFIKCIHVMAGIIFVGITIANYFYICNSRRYQDPKLLRYALKASFWGDLVIVFIIVFQYCSATLLVHFNHLSFTTPWIRVAYLAFSVVNVCWLLLLLIKRHYYQHPSSINPVLTVCYHALNIFSLIIFAAIIHDAVLHTTYLGFLV